MQVWWGDSLECSSPATGVDTSQADWDSGRKLGTCSGVMAGKSSICQVSHLPLQEPAPATPRGILHARAAWTLTGVAFAEDLNGRGHLLLADPLVLLAFGGCLEALPGQGAQVEVHEHVAQALQVISTALLCTRRTHSKGQGLLLSVPMTRPPLGLVATPRQIILRGKGPEAKPSYFHEAQFF